MTEPLHEGMIRKGGHNPETSQVEARPPAPFRYATPEEAAVHPHVKATPKPDAGTILDKAARTFRERGAVYRDNHTRLGKVLEALYPDGIELKTALDHERFALVVLKVVKATRYAVNFKKGHHDSIHDDVVYSAMLEAIDERLI